MFLTELDVVNKCLASMGEMPVNSIANSTNPMVTNARAAFNDANTQEQGPGWWFNIEAVTLQPQTDGQVFVPADCLSLCTVGNFNPMWLSIRGRKLYDNNNSEYFTTGSPIKVKIIRFLPFTDLPYNMQRLVRASTVEKFQLDYDGDQQKQTAAAEEYQASYALVMMDHTRAVKANVLNQGEVGSVRYQNRIPYATRRYR
jgi:hypothetical protein